MEKAKQKHSSFCKDSREQNAAPKLGHSKMGWWAVLDSNQRPRDYESRALTN